MNWKKISLSILVGCGITLLTGLFSNMPSMLLGASHYGYPLAWLFKLIVAPEYFPWRVNIVNLIVDIAFWSVIIGAVLLLVNTRRRKKIAIFVILLVLFIATFSMGMLYYKQPNSAEGSNTSDIRELATVDDIDIAILESFPVQINVIARGNLPDACTRIDDITVNREGNTFMVTITTLRPAGAVCAQVVTPFEEVVALDVVGLEAGTYTVNVNGITGTFQLQVDNILD